MRPPGGGEAGIPGEGATTMGAWATASSFTVVSASPGLMSMGPERPPERGAAPAGGTVGSPARPGTATTVWAGGAVGSRVRPANSSASPAGAAVAGSSPGPGATPPSMSDEAE